MNNNVDKQYLDFLRHVYENGIDRSNGTDKQDPAYKPGITTTGTRGIFWYQMKFNLSEWFPLLTTKKVHFPAVAHELIWLIKGQSNIEYLCQNKVRIWNERPFDKYKKHPDYQGETIEEFADKIATDHDFAVKHGDLWPVYGQQRRWRPTKNGGHLDQLQNAIDKIKANPDSRRNIVIARNPEFVDQMALPPCHMMYQFFVADGKLSLQMYQRSADIFLGVPFNIASYALLTHMVAQVTGLEVGDFVHTFGDAHIYDNHFAQVEEQLSREPKSLPTIKLNPDIKNINDFTFADMTLENYDPHPTIKAQVSL